MEIDEYRRMYELEESHWWYKGLHDLVLGTVRDIFAGRNDLKILDAGCGTGLALKRLNESGQSFGVDLSDVALGYCRRRGLARIYRASIAELPFGGESFDLAVSMDVLCSLTPPDEKTAYREIQRVLKKEGYLVLNLPAHDYLKRGQDRNAHVRHRYSIEEARRKLSDSGFDIIKIGYRNAFSFPIIFISKFVINKFYKERYTELGAVWPGLNAFLYGMLRLENIMLKKINMPFGMSIFCIARKR